MRVVVAGAGIVGASIAYSLAKAGAAVTVIDGTGPASHASRGTFAWINATWAKQPRSYHRLNQESVANWHGHEKELQIPVTWGGSLEWFGSAERQARLSEQVAEQARWDEPARYRTLPRWTVVWWPWRPRERPDVYLAIMHSGVSLAPLVGELVTRELAGSALDEPLGPYRPTRNIADVRRY